MALPQSSSDLQIITLPARPWLQLVKITVLYSVLGPPLGLLFGVMMLSAFQIVGSDTGFMTALRGYVAFFSPGAALQLYGWPYLAVLPALVLGVLFGWHEGWRGQVPLVGAVMAGGGVGALYYLVSDFLGWGAGDFGASFSLVSAALATFVLQLGLRSFLGGDRPSGAMEEHAP